MGHEISQFDIPDRQLMAGSGQACMWSDIGEAKITHTIFGRARIRVVREKDKILRAWLLAALAAIVLSIAAWWGWIALQQSELLAATPPLSERISVSPPVFNPETIPPVRSSGRSRTESLVQSEIDNLVASPNRLPPRPTGLLSAKPVAEKPATAQPVMAGNPSPPLATGNSPLPNLTNTQSHSRIPAPGQLAVPAAAKPSVQAPANKPAPAAPPAEPLSKKDTSKPSSASNDQTADTDAQPVNARGTAIIFVQPDNAKP